MSTAFDVITTWRPDQAIYDTYRDDHDLPPRKVMFCGTWEKAEIAERYYWRLSGCPVLSAAGKTTAATVLLDIALQSDAREARKLVQRAFGEKESGEWSERLIDRLVGCDDRALAVKLEACRPNPNPSTNAPQPVD